jgi:predicted nucleic acid-binding protein
VQDDPDDNKFIECALECKANYIISGDTHLLNLKEYEGIKIIKSSEFLKVFYKQKP